MPRHLNDHPGDPRAPSHRLLHHRCFPRRTPRFCESDLRSSDSERGVVARVCVLLVADVSDLPRKLGKSTHLVDNRHADALCSSETSSTCYWQICCVLLSIAASDVVRFLVQVNFRVASTTSKWNMDGLLCRYESGKKKGRIEKGKGGHCKERRE